LEIRGELFFLEIEGKDERDDFYQMCVYLTRYNSIESIVLLYPYADSSIHDSGKCLNSWHLEGIENKKILNLKICLKKVQNNTRMDMELPHQTL
jgi:hypothetical protein